MKLCNISITAVYKALNYNIRDGVTSQRQKKRQANKLSRKDFTFESFTAVFSFSHS
jgi:hypothetical protein